jgi:hypothetical protein
LKQYAEYAKDLILVMNSMAKEICNFQNMQTNIQNKYAEYVKIYVPKNMCTIVCKIGTISNKISKKCHFIICIVCKRICQRICTVWTYRIMDIPHYHMQNVQNNVQNIRYKI